MGQTFGEVMEDKKQSAISEKINILNDFRLILEKMDLKMNFQYIFLIKPHSLCEEDDSMTDKLDTLSENLERTSQKILTEQHNWRELMGSKFDAVNDDIHAMKEEFNQMQKQVQQKVDGMQNEMREHMQSLIDKLDGLEKARGGDDD